VRCGCKQPLLLSGGTRRQTRRAFAVVVFLGLSVRQFLELFLGSSTYERQSRGETRLYETSLYKVVN
jgi:hypothetical protein